MKRTAEVLLIVWTMVGMYCAIPKRSDRVLNPNIGTPQLVLVADGSEPLPLCRGKVCK